MGCTTIGSTLWYNNYLDTPNITSRYTRDSVLLVLVSGCYVLLVLVSGCYVLLVLVSGCYVLLVLVSGCYVLLVLVRAC